MRELLFTLILGGMFVPYAAKSTEFDFSGETPSKVVLRFPCLHSEVIGGVPTHVVGFNTHGHHPDIDGQPVVAFYHPKYRNLPKEALADSVPVKTEKTSRSRKIDVITPLADDFYEDDPPASGTICLFDWLERILG